MCPTCVKRIISRSEELTVFQNIRFEEQTNLKCAKTKLESKVEKGPFEKLFTVLMFKANEWK